MPASPAETTSRFRLFQQVSYVSWMVLLPICWMGVILFSPLQQLTRRLSFVVLGVLTLIGLSEISKLRTSVVWSQSGTMAPPLVLLSAGDRTAFACASSRPASRLTCPDRFRLSPEAGRDLRAGGTTAKPVPKLRKACDSSEERNGGYLRVS
jgi:hypothetical protein